jgi:uncharacterized membrane protein
MPHALAAPELALVTAAMAVALLFRPWEVLRAPALRAPWLAALVILPLLWAAQSRLPPDFPAALSGACLLVLMFGWPLAVWTLLPVAVCAALLDGSFPRGALQLAAWHGMLPASLALLIGIAVRRVLPPHVFVYILARGFIGSALAVMGAGVVAALVRPLPSGTSVSSLLVGQWLMAFGEAVLTGMLTAIFVAYRPEWLLTWSDRRYLRPPAR